MNVFKYETDLDTIRNCDTPVIFLAGPTVRGNQQHLTSWRIEAIEEFRRHGFDGALVVPEFTDRAASDLGKDWIVEWEFTGLRRADSILFWIPRTRELIGLTTNWEHGYWVGRERNKVVYGRPDDAYRISYLDIMWKLAAEERGDSGKDIFCTLSDTVAASIKMARQEYQAKPQKTSVCGNS